MKTNTVKYIVSLSGTKYKQNRSEINLGGIEMPKCKWMRCMVES